MHSKVTFEFIQQLLAKVDECARRVDSEDYGLPRIYNERDVKVYDESLVRIILEHFDLQLEISPKILKVMSSTGCSFETASNLIQSLEEL